MTARVLADVVLTLHLAFLVFIAVGGFIAVRWRWVIWPHLGSLIWGAGIVLIGWTCPLTVWEVALRGRAESDGFATGFVDRYIEDVIYPEEATPYLRALMALLVVISYVILRRRRTAGLSRPTSPI